MTKPNQYYLQNKLVKPLGNAPAWWAKNGNGYTHYIRGAEIFSEERALRYVQRDPDKFAMFKCDDVDARLHLVFDDQDFGNLGTDAPCGWPTGYAPIYEPSDTIHIHFADNGYVRRWQEKPFEGSIAFSTSQLVMRIGTYKNKAQTLSNAIAGIQQNLQDILGTYECVDTTHEDYRINTNLAVAETLNNLSKITPLPLLEAIPCVGCGSPAETSTPDNADMCHECFGAFNAAAYDQLQQRFKDLLKRDYPHIQSDDDIADALDPIRPLPRKEG